MNSLRNLSELFISIEFVKFIWICWIKKKSLKWFKNSVLARRPFTLVLVKIKVIFVRLKMKNFGLCWLEEMLLSLFLTHGSKRDRKMPRWNVSSWLSIIQTLKMSKWELNLWFKVQILNQFFPTYSYPVPFL